MKTPSDDQETVWPVFHTFTSVITTTRVNCFFFSLSLLQKKLWLWIFAEEPKLREDSAAVRTWPTHISTVP